MPMVWFKGEYSILWDLSKGKTNVEEAFLEMAKKALSNEHYKWVYIHRSFLNGHYQNLLNFVISILVQTSQHFSIFIKVFHIFVSLRPIYVPIYISTPEEEKQRRCSCWNISVWYRLHITQILIEVHTSFFCTSQYSTDSHSLFHSIQMYYFTFSIFHWLNVCINRLCKKM